MKNKNLLLIVQTAMLLAVTLAFQQLRLLIGTTPPATIVIGSLVNLALFVTAATVGWRGSVVVSVLAPVVAALQGHLPHPLLIPFVAAGNLALVLVFELVERRKGGVRRWLAMAAASVVKFAVLYALVILLFVPVLLPGLGLPDAAVKKMAAALPLSFSWTQLLTAAIGGVVAYPVIGRLRRALASREGREN